MATSALNCDRVMTGLNSIVPINTISDLENNAKIIFYFPSAFIIDFFETLLPKVAYFFEVTCATGSGFGGLILSALLWLVLFGGLSSLGDRIGRKMT